jgi:hypothetical protein
MWNLRTAEIVQAVFGLTLAIGSLVFLSAVIPA